MPSPAFQFYPGDFLSDGNQMSLSLAGAGAYIRLIAVCWKEGSLPDDTKLLWKLAQADSRQEFEEVWPSVRVCFRKKRGRLIHPRLDKERAKQDAFRSKMSESGKKGAKRRHEKPAPVKDNSSQATATPEVGLSDPKTLQSSASSVSSASSKNTLRVVSDELAELWAIHASGTKHKAGSELRKALVVESFAVIKAQLIAYTNTFRQDFTGAALWRWLRDHRWEDDYTEKSGVVSRKRSLDQTFQELGIE